MAALIRHSWYQMKETKQLKPPQNPKRLHSCNHKSPIDYTVCNKGMNDYSQKSTEQKNNCANNRQIESQTNHN